MGRKAGLSDAKLRAVPGDDLTPFNDTERLVIELADALTNTPSDVSDELYARLRNQFSEEQLIQLAAQIAFRKLSRALESTFQRRERQSLLLDRPLRSVTMRYGLAEALQVCLKLSRFPPYYSERSEESLIISSSARQGKSQRCFASLNMRGKRSAPILAFFPNG